MPAPPSAVDVVEPIAAALHGAASAADLEQAVRGIDCKSELELHAILRGGLEGAGFGAFSEVRYPGDRNRRKRSEGRRCDLVVTASGLPIDDGLPQLDLFRPGARCAVEEALWLEVKVVAQFVEGGANAGYSGAIQGPLFRDVRKLASDPALGGAALLLLLFTADREVADHDLDAWVSIGRGRGLSIGDALVRRISISGRLGNELLTVALFPVSAPVIQLAL